MRVLFIGNSHTYANGLPYQVRAMVSHALGGGACEAFMVAPGDKPLAWHGQEPTTTMTIRFHRWDHIVLQQATHPFGGYDNLAADFAGLEPHLQAARAEVLLYMTWARKDRPGDQGEIDAAFERLAAEKGLRLAPVSRAWRALRAARPDLEPYAPDGSHASPTGTYLTACVFFGALTGRPPASLPTCIRIGEETLVELTDDDAEALQGAARLALEEHRRTEQ